MRQRLTLVDEIKMKDSLEIPRYGKYSVLRLKLHYYKSYLYNRWTSTNKILQWLDQNGNHSCMRKIWYTYSFFFPWSQCIWFIGFPVSLLKSDIRSWSQVKSQTCLVAKICKCVLRSVKLHPRWQTPITSPLKLFKYAF